MIGSFGAVQFPLNPADYLTSFTAADPARERLLGFFKAALLYELGAIWTQVTDTLPGGTGAHQLRGSSVVEDTLELEPIAKVMQERKGGFPLLALHRVDEAPWTNRTANIRERAQNWDLHWILGPLTTDHARKLLDACLLVEAVVEGVTQQRKHEAWESGAVQFTDSDPSGISTVKVVKRAGPGQARYGGDENGTIHWATVITLSTVETASETPNDGSGNTGDPMLQGATYEVGLGSPEGTLPSVILADTDASGDIILD